MQWNGTKKSQPKKRGENGHGYTSSIGGLRMTYKERLENIDKRAKHKVLGNIEGEIKYRLTEINTEDYEWLIKQAERVQELEELLEELVEGYKIELMIKDNAKKRAKQENKRYREAIERALDESGWGDEGNALAKMISILAKALEGEE